MECPDGQQGAILGPAGLTQGRDRAQLGETGGRAGM